MADHGKVLKSLRAIRPEALRGKNGPWQADASTSARDSCLEPNNTPPLTGYPQILKKGSKS